MSFIDELATQLPNGSKDTPVSVFTRHRAHRIFWDVVAPKGYKLNVLQESDVIFDKYDLKIRKLI